MNDETASHEYWDNLYNSRQTAWDIGYPSTPLKTYIDQLTDKNAAILVPGCGNGYEVAYLLQQGFTNVTAIDISPVLTARLEEKLREWVGKTLSIITSDFFTTVGQYDIILEQTFFCALPPVRREDYVHQVHRLLKPGGRLAGVLFDRDFEGGPPFGGHRAEYEQLFKENFQLKVLAPCNNSIPPRAGSELFIVAEKV
ncbi:methyltransferase [Paraflavitalea pollutisoli]|uniref:methyltransferase n=1 Tax=Paraflavitalea pollutisoli TaxID=3034143 RepID=UPI0023EBC7BB|nr:methyltransferase [Paraflavitalea sp. H1-2-19X]